MFSYCVSNHNTQNITNQAFYKDNFHLLYLLGLKGAKKKIVDVLLKYDTIYEDMELSREEIARQSCTSVRHVGRCLLELERAGILTRLHRGYRAPLIRYANSYILNPIFHELWSRKELSYKYPILKWVDHKKLEQRNVISKGHFSKNVPVLYKYKNNDSTSRFKSEEGKINSPLLFIKGSKQTAVVKVRVSKCYRLLDVAALSSNPISKPKEAFNGAKGEAMASFLEKLRELENFGNYEIEQLKEYPEKVLLDAYLKLQQTENVTNTFSLFRSICKRLATYSRYKVAAAGKVNNATAANRDRYGNEGRSHYGPDKSPPPPMVDGKYTVQPGDKGMPVGCTIYSRKYYEQLEEESRHLNLQSSSTSEGEHAAVKEEIIYGRGEPGSTEKKDTDVDKASTLEELQKALGDEFSPFDYYVDG